MQALFEKPELAHNITQFFTWAIQLSGLLFIVRAAFWVASMKTFVTSWMTAVKDNHLHHLQDGVETLVELQREQNTAMQLHDARQTAHNDESVRLLQDLKRR